MLAKARVLEDNTERRVMDDDILEQHRLEAAAAMEVEAKRRIAWKIPMLNRMKFSEIPRWTKWKKWCPLYWLG